MNWAYSGLLRSNAALCDIMVTTKARRATSAGSAGVHPVTRWYAALRSLLLLICQRGSKRAVTPHPPLRYRLPGGLTKTGRKSVQFCEAITTFSAFSRCCIASFERALLRRDPEDSLSILPMCLFVSAQFFGKPRRV